LVSSSLFLLLGFQILLSLYLLYLPVERLYQVPYLVSLLFICIFALVYQSLVGIYCFLELLKQGRVIILVKKEKVVEILQLRLLDLVMFISLLELIVSLRGNERLIERFEDKVKGRFLLKLRRSVQV
jgi:hypothetical protein